MKRLLITAALGAGLFLGLSGNSGCDTQPDTAVDRQREQAAQEVATEQTYCYECENIKHRRELFGKPGVIGYVVFLNQAGQPIHYLAVDGKCTSSGKRLTQPKQERFVEAYGHDNDGDGVATGGSWDVIDGPSEDGTFGTSDDYIYCFDTGHRYWQWKGDYLFSDKPFDLTIKPLVIDTSTPHAQHQ